MSRISKIEDNIAGFLTFKAKFSKNTNVNKDGEKKVKTTLPWIKYIDENNLIDWEEIKA